MATIDDIHQPGSAASAPTGLLDALTSRIRGEVDASHLARANYSTDASNYRILPQVVVCPTSADDVRATIEIAREFGVPITPRGGGTSVAGNAIGPGIVLDFSRHMNRILDIDPEARTATVEPGVVMSDLQARAARFGLRFGPDPSTQNRATFGGMIGNNACGPHAVAWGRTADNVVALYGFDGVGRVISTNDAGGPGSEQADELARLVEANLALIRTESGRFSRQVSGYSLEHMLPENGRDLAKFFVGTEGTLGIWTSATLRLVPIAAAPNLIVLGYPDMPAAADAVPAISAYKPLAIEGIDAELVDVVRRAKGSVPALPHGGGWLLIEVGAQEGEPLSVIEERISGILEVAGTDAVVVHEPGPAATELWRIRADGAGLAGRTPAGKAAWPGWEDSAVPPENLGDYLRDLRSLMDSYDLTGLMFGHFGDGCVHVRIDFPIDSPAGIPTFRGFLTQAADLAISHGGSLSGEHGDGRARSELLTKMYSPEMLELFARVKAIFDPDGILNPGNITDPQPLEVNLRRPHARRSTYAGGFHFHKDDGDFTKAVHRCTGVGNCRADRTEAGRFMCPSYLATKDEKDVTRGRARVLQELTNGSLIANYSDSTVAASLDLCLACKACSTDCPTGVDMATYKSEALHRGYKGRIRPRTHYILGNLPLLAGLVTSIPGIPVLANAALKISPLRKLVFSLAGLAPERKMPGFTTKRFSSIAHDAGLSSSLAAVAGESGKKYVMLWSDSFSETLDTAGAQAMVELLQRAGYTVLIPPEKACCGLTYISTGQLGRAKKELTNLLETLAPFAASGIPIVGVEPSCTAVLREDMLDLLPEDARTVVVSEMTYTLAELLTEDEPIGPGEDFELPDLTGVDVVAQPHCHHYSVMGWDTDEALLRKAGADVTRVSGCCGLAGIFGFEKGHYDVSAKVAANDLLPKLSAAGEDAVYLADGFSCRTQAKELAGDQGVHLAELLRDGAGVRRRSSGSEKK